MDYIYSLDSTTVDFCLFIVFFASLNLLLFSFYILRMKMEIKKTTLSIKEKIDFTHNIENGSQKQLFALSFDNYNFINDKIIENKMIRKYWIKYNKSFEWNHKEKKLENTSEINKEFDIDTIINNSFNVRYFTSIPNILTGLGLLFTFVGLMLGIKEASIGLSSNNIELAKASLNPLLTGASIAFSTSIVGLSLSMVFSIYEKIILHSIEKEILNFTDVISNISEYINTDKLATKQLKAIQLQTDALNGFKVEQQRISDETIIRVSNEFKDTLLKNASSELEQLRELVTSINKVFSENIYSFTELQKGVNISTGKLLSNLDKGTENIINKLNNTFYDLSENEKSKFNLLMKDIELKHTLILSETEKQIKLSSKTFNNNIDKINDVFVDLPNKIKKSSEDSLLLLIDNIDKKATETLPYIVSNLAKMLNDELEKVTAKIKISDDNLSILLNKVPDLVNQMSLMNSELIEHSQILTQAQEITKDDIILYRSLSENLIKASENQDDIVQSNKFIMRNLRDTISISSQNIQTINESSSQLKTMLHTQTQYGNDVENSINNILKKLNLGLIEYAGITNKYMSTIDLQTKDSLEKLISTLNELNSSIVKKEKVQ